MRRGVQAALLIFAFSVSARAAELQELRGRVVDETGQPVEGVDVTYFWIANGPFWDKDGKPVDQSTDQVRDKYFGPDQLGQMEPGVREVVKTAPDGTFQIKISDIYHTLIAMDVARARGGFGVVSKANPKAPIEIRLGPLVRVRGSFEGPAKGLRPSWTNLYVHVPVDTTRPLDMTRIAMCGSREAKFLLSLPPGRYLIEAYDAGVTAQLYGKAFVLDADTPEVDLGVIFLPPSDSIIAKRRQSQAAGTWGDYTKHYGKKPPAWHVTDARGVDRDVQISDFKGKWVLLDFWGLGCAPCLRRMIPELMKFYEDHAHQHDQFEILSICIDADNELKSLAGMDRALAPIVEHVWGGKTIPFPILLDCSYRTWENFGLQGMGTTLLIDPEGNLVEGDQMVLAKKLKR